ncbi:Glycosyltransferase 34 protein, variant 2 [Metarhizium acridum]|nr:Glycosyltransferase 34 protein, variant 2 [Metarhizium acridum]
MHLPYPPRKRSNPPPFRPMSSKISLLRRSRLKNVAIGALLFLGALYFLFGGKKPDPYHEHVPSGHPSVVLVTVIDPSEWNTAYLDTIKENRERYAARHGYQAMVVNALDYDTQGAPRSWAKIFAMRHALSKYPDCKFIWYLDQDAYIMDPTKSLEDQVTRPSKLESLMIKDYPVVPPDSIIKTFSHLRGESIDLIVTQDKEGLVHKSVVIRNGEFAKFFVETWFDPLYRSYNFQKAERHALVRVHLFISHASRCSIDLKCCRNISSNGTQPYFPNWPSSPNEHSRLTRNPPSASNIKKATLSCSSRIVPRRGRRAARPSRHATGRR